MRDVGHRVTFVHGAKVVLVGVEHRGCCEASGHGSRAGSNFSGLALTGVAEPLHELLWRRQTSSVASNEAGNKTAMVNVVKRMIEV